MFIVYCLEFIVLWFSVYGLLFIVYSDNLFPGAPRQTLNTRRIQSGRSDESPRRGLR